MGPKKSVPNAFFMFMQEQRVVRQRQGRFNIPNQQLTELISPLWKAMPEAEKERYKELAKVAKSESKGKPVVKYTNRGNIIADVVKQAESKKKAQSEMENEIERIVSEGRRNNTLSRKKFFMVHLNFLCEARDGIKVTLPCELGLVEFSIEEGVTRFLHSFIKPESETIPLGSTCTIAENAKLTHGIELNSPPLQHKAASTRQVDLLLANFESFLKDGYDNKGNPPPLYTTEKLTEKVSSMLNFLYSRSNQAVNPDKFKIFPVQELVFQLSKVFANDQLISSVDAQTQLYRFETFNELIGVSCPYHLHIDKTQFCSLTYAKNWCFAISKLFDSEHGATGACGNVPTLPVSIYHTPWSEEDPIEEEASPWKYASDEIDAIPYEAEFPALKPLHLQEPKNSWNSQSSGKVTPKPKIVSSQVGQPFDEEVPMAFSKLKI